MKIRNPSHILLVGIVRAFGSNFKAFKFSIYLNNMFKEDTLAWKPHCAMSGKSLSMLYLFFNFFLTPHSPFCMLLENGHKSQAIYLGEGGACK